MFNKLIAAIVGRPGEGQRKMALGTYVITILGFILVACVTGIVFIKDPADAPAKAPLLQMVAAGTLTALSTTFGLLVVGNVGEYMAKRGQP